MSQERQGMLITVHARRADGQLSKSNQESGVNGPYLPLHACQSRGGGCQAREEMSCRGVSYRQDPPRNKPCVKDVDIETGLHREHRSVGRTLTHHHDVASTSRDGQ